ncbi:MAG TPA: GWxTD domain-containing protein [Pyrinomonadaceae bacterium]|nr:GWxTD domain-containing protein [Pyrinomonadaceae bacterium]
MKPDLRFVTLILALLFSSSAVALQAQEAPKPTQVRQSKSTQNPEDRDRKIKSEPNDAYTRWINEEGSLITTPEERRAYEKLTTNEEREQLIGEIWRRRDPTPDTEENEYRDAFYERIAYANEHFTSGKLGWLTDRGRIYVKFGKPDEVESHPAGGQYERPANEGGGSTTTYPFEKWFYRYINGVGSGVEIEFVDATGSGEYRIARDFNEKNALAQVPGYASVDPMMDAAYLRPGDSPLGRIELLANLEKAPQVDSRFPGGSTPTPSLDDNPLNFDIRADFFRLADNRVITAFTVQTENKDLVFQDSGGLQIARLNIVGKIIGIADRPVGRFEDVVTTTAMKSELTEALDRRSAYAKVTVLRPGNYRVDVWVRDVASGASGLRRLGFQVPKYEDGKLATSSMILAAKLEKLEGALSTSQFVIGDTKVIPNLTGSYRRGEPVGVYLQLYNAGIDQTTLRPAVDVEYLLSKDGKELMKQPEDWRGVSETDSRLILSRLLDTKTLAPGDYEVSIRVHDRVSGQSLQQSAKFTLAP